jgi:excinuclease ABC subunit C
MPEVHPLTRLLQIGAPEYRLVTQLRDEAHRFAITFHRNRRDKATVKSVLTNIKGLGPKLIEIVHLAGGSWCAGHGNTSS